MTEPDTNERDTPVRVTRLADQGRETDLQKSTATISSDQALKIARTDAEVVYRDLSIYRISVSLEDNGWLVDYELKDQQLHGGGPHYVIDAQTGEILSKRYDQ